MFRRAAIRCRDARSAKGLRSRPRLFQGLHGDEQANDYDRHMHLIIFDVDGTLTHSTGVDACCFQRAVLEVLGVPIDTNWAQYQHQTDSGILSEVLERHGWEPSRATTEQVKRRFFELLRGACSADPSCSVEVAGARAMLQLLARSGHAQVAIATGAWAESARTKLRFAGIDVGHLPFASADDSPKRERILEIVIARASDELGRKPRVVTYVGDAPWDVAAAQRAHLRFIGVAGGSVERRALELAGANILLSDFADSGAFNLLVGEP
jgi:phosphoglycolate phosphatase-like HAD superfamily hydrolase